MGTILKTAGPAAPGFDPARLNATGKRRITKGLTCFVHPDPAGMVEAVCVDFGLSARAATVPEARKELFDVINTAWQVAMSEGMAEELLNQPNNAAAERQMQRAIWAFRLFTTLLWPFHVLGEIRAFLARVLVDEYDEPIDTSQHVYAC